MSDGGLLQQTMVYLAAAVISVPVARKLGLGSVLGYLIAGILIGPFVFGIVGEQEDVLHFAEFGVVMMLFLVGLELRPSVLWQMRTSILGLGGAQVLATTGVVYLFARAFDVDHNEALAIGMIFSLSSTAIVLQSLNERGWTKTSGGQASFSVLLFQDIAFIPMLAILPLLATGAATPDAAHGGHAGADLAGWQQALMFLLIAAAMVVGSHYLARPVFRFIAESRLPEIFTAAALLLVVALAYVMQMIGLSPALGAFIGGVVLAESEFRHELESDIEPFKGLLLGLFFIAVGASMDFSLFVEHWRQIIVFVVLVMLGKFVLLFILGRVFRMELTQNFLFAVALCQGGEFGFVLFTTARQYNVVQPETADLLILVVALTMALTPLLMIAYDRAMVRLSNKRAGQEEEDHIDENDNPVIIAGYGRFGQVVGRLLHANGIGVTILDDDASHIERVRRFGYKVYFGDASRIDLLQRAGAEQAKMLVIAIDERGKILQIVQGVRRHFPHLKILARANDRTHAYDLMEAGVDILRRETFASALELGTEALRLLGFRSFQAHRSAELFRCHDEQTLEELFELYKEDEELFVLQSRKRREDLEKLLRADDKDLDAFADHSWERPGA